MQCVAVWAAALMVAMADAAVRNTSSQFIAAGNWLLEVQIDGQVDYGKVLQLSPKVSELIFVHQDCGRRDPKCPIYCDDELIAKLYCTLVCYPQMGVQEQFLCGRQQKRYNPRLSRFSKSLNANWSPAFMKMRPLFGRFWSDRLQILQMRQRISFKQKIYRRSLNVSFVGALLFDKRILQYSSAVLGLRPGPRAGVVQLLNALEHKNPRMSISLRRQDQDVHRHRYADAFNFLTLGAVDMWRCVGWQWPALASRDFAPLVPTVDFMGVEFRNVQLMFELNIDIILIPQGMANTLVQTGVLKEHMKAETYTIFTYDCKTNRAVRFFDLNHQEFLKFDNETLFVREEEFRMPCVIGMYVDSSDIYSNRVGENPVINIGDGIFNHHCLGFDHDRNTMGFARRRPWSHPWFATGMAIRG